MFLSMRSCCEHDVNKGTDVSKKGERIKIMGYDYGKITVKRTGFKLNQDVSLNVRPAHLDKL